ncbi:MAG: 6-bladed beta-propeller [Prevotellaceae bacterium]|nr:6-bladed beta-propeller [Prevotellaceae bacterium]
MKKNTFLLILVFLLPVCACEQKKTGRAVNHQIDFDYNVCINKLDMGEFDLGDYTDSVMQIIPLETTNEALIAKIDHIEIRNDRIYIMDRLAKSVYVYDMTGKYLNRINKVGQVRANTDFCRI